MKAAAGGNSPMILGAVLIVGALLYSRSMQARATTTVARPSGTGSMPGSAGTGTSQIVGGIVGSLLQSVAGMINNGTTPSWQTWEPLSGVDYAPQETNGFVAVQDIFDAAITNQPVYQVETTQQIFDSVTGGGYDGGSIIRNPGAYW